MEKEALLEVRSLSVRYPGNKKEVLHQVDLTLYATRYNTLAALHHLSSIPFSQGPDCWRSTNDLWNYEYSFVPQGIMSSPRFY